MHVAAASWVVLAWTQALTFVRSQDCTLQQFINGPLYNSNFDISDLQASYAGGRQVRVGCNVGFSGFFKLVCIEGKWESRGTECQPRSCGHPGDAQFADFHLEKGDDFVFGSQVVYTCHKGYQMVSRINYRRCMVDGWDGLVPICEAQQCPVIQVNGNVQVFGDPDEAIYGNVLKFSCKSSSDILVGAQEIYCNENGEWSGREPTCQEVKCLVPEIENGHVTQVNREYRRDDILHFQCIQGYQRTVEIPSKCTQVGSRAEWSPMPSCEIVKCKLQLPPVRGTMYQPASRNRFSVGDTVTVMCWEKYWISRPQDSSAVITCKPNGEWSVMPVCQEVTCPNRPDEHVSWWSHYSYWSIKLGTTVQYHCDSGFRSTDGTNKATCTRDGWRPKPMCQARTCDRRDIINADVVNYKEKYNQGEKAQYVCREGYKGQFVLTCYEEEWTGHTTYCREITCHRNDLRDAHIVGDIRQVYKYKEQVEYHDYYGRALTVTCGKDGWTTPRPTGQKCKKPNINDAYIVRNEKSSYSDGARVQFACKNDDDRRFVAACNQGVWTGIQNCSACPDAVVSHGFFVGPYNDTLYYACNTGYKLAKGWWGAARCEDGVWSGFKDCIEVNMCGELPVIPNGEVRATNRTYEQGERIQIVCKDGHSAQADILTCLRGKWSSNGISLEKICTLTAKNCKAPSQLENALISTSYQREYPSGSTVRYHCRESYSMRGEATATCDDGIWKGGPTECTPAEQ